MKNLIGPLAAGGGEVVGAAAAIAMLAVAPKLAAVPVFGAVIAKIAEEAIRSALAPTELSRTDAFFKSAQVELEDRLESGATIRPDFLSNNQSDVDFSREMLEGIVQKAKHSYEERKIPYIAALYVSIATEHSCTRAEANFLIQLAESLGFTQYCLLHLYSQRGAIKLRDWRIEESTPVLGNQHALVRLSENLREQGLVDQIMRGADDIIEVGEHPNGFLPSDATLSRFGKRIHAMLGLSKLPELQYMHLADEL